MALNFAYGQKPKKGCQIEMPSTEFLRTSFVEVVTSPKCFQLQATLTIRPIRGS